MLMKSASDSMLLNVAFVQTPGAISKMPPTHVESAALKSKRLPASKSSRGDRLSR
jgi:hypothetical protein